MAIFPKFSIKKIFLLILLVMVSLVLSAVKLISGGRTTSQAQAQCWTGGGVGGSSGDCTNCSCAGAGGGVGGGGSGY